MKNILIISGSPRKKGNSQLLCESFCKGALEAKHCVNLIRLADKNIHFCRACDACMKNGGHPLRADGYSLHELPRHKDLTTNNS